MTRGIYFMANDRVLDYAIALVNSIRAFDAETPLMMIPYSQPYARVATVLSRSPGVALYDDLPRVRRFMRQARRIFGPHFFPRPDNLRKQLCWFGPFDEFLYLDVDIVVFERISDVLAHLSDYDFVCYSDQHCGGIAHVFTPAVITDGVFTDEQLQEVFNAGFWASRRGLFSEAELYVYWEQCAAHKRYLDRSRGGSDQPVLNYVILRNVPRRRNLYCLSAREAGMWAGAPHFLRQGDRLFDPAADKPVKFLHWAGIPIAPGGAYWDIWEQYRYRSAAVHAPLCLPHQHPVSNWRPRMQRLIQRVFDPLLAMTDRRRLRRRAHA